MLDEQLVNETHLHSKLVMYWPFGKIHGRRGRKNAGHTELFVQR